MGIFQGPERDEKSSSIGDPLKSRKDPISNAFKTKAGCKRDEMSFNGGDGIGMRLRCKSDQNWTV